MSTQIASLYATISADASGLKKGLEGTKAKLGEAARGFEQLTGTTVAAAAKTALFTAGLGLAYKAAGKVVDVMKDSVTETMAYAKEVRDVARYTGTSAEESSKFLQIADDLQIKTQTLQVGFRMLNKQGIQPTIENIKEMGVEYKTLGAVEKAQYAMEMFGARSGMEMAKMLEMTSEQIDEVARSSEMLGLVLDTEAIQKTEEYRLSVDQLGDAWKGVKTQLGMEIIPEIAKLTTAVSENITEQAAWDRVMETGQYTADQLFGKIQDGESIFAIYDNITKGAAISTDDFAGRAGAATQAMQDLNTVLGATVTENGGLIASLGGLAAEFDPLATSQKLFNEGLATGAKDLVDMQQAQLNAIAVTGEMTESQVAYAEAQMENLRNIRDLNDARKKNLVTEGEYLNIMKDNKVTNEELNEVVDSSIPIWAQAGDNIAYVEKSIIGLTTAFGALSTTYDPVTVGQGLLNSLLAIGAKDEVDYAQNVLNSVAAKGKMTEAQLAEGLAAQEELRNLRDLNAAYLAHAVTEQEVWDIMRDGVVTNDELGESLSVTEGNMTDLMKATGLTAEQWSAYADTAYQSAGEVKGAVDGIASAAGIAASAIDGIGAAISALPTYTALTIDVIYNIKGQPVGIGGAGETFDRGGFVGKAAGGPVWQGAAYVVGEQGPEMFVPNTSGRVIPNNQLGGMGGGDTINIYNNSTGAAALTMAIIAQSHRARLSRSMGG